jgi:hypothetical protein
MDLSETQQEWGDENFKRMFLTFFNQLMEQLNRLNIKSTASKKRE